MKVTHPVKGYSGYVSGPRSFGLHFLAGVAHVRAADVPGPVRRQWESDGFGFTDERRVVLDKPSGGDAEGDQAAE